MASRSLKHQFLPAAFIILGAAVFGAAQQSSGVKHNTRPEAAVPAATPAIKKNENDSARYSYEFTQPEFYVRHIQIEHDASGRGVIKFQRLHDETVYEEPLALSSSAVTRISDLWQTLHFLDSDENYQSERQYPHLGTMCLKMERDSRRRAAEFNWSNNKDAFALANEYRSVADQAILIFAIFAIRGYESYVSALLRCEQKNVRVVHYCRVKQRCEGDKRIVLGVNDERWNTN